MKFAYLFVLFAMLLAFDATSQTDTIVTKNGKAIVCEITFVEQDNIDFIYTHQGNKHTDFIEFKKVAYFVKKGVKQTPFDIQKVESETHPIQDLKVKSEIRSGLFIVAGAALIGSGFCTLLNANRTVPSPPNATSYNFSNSQSSTQYLNDLNKYNSSLADYQKKYKNTTNASAFLILVSGISITFAIK